MLEGLKARREGNDRGWDVWMASPTQWTWVLVDSGGWWWTGMPGVLWFMGFQGVGHDWATELNWIQSKAHVYDVEKLNEENYQKQCANTLSSVKVGSLYLPPLTSDLFQILNIVHEQLHPICRDHLWVKDLTYISSFLPRPYTRNTWVLFKILILRPHPSQLNQNIWLWDPGVRIF